MPRADKLIAIALCVAAVAVTTTPGAAQQWPTQPVRIVVGFGPGSTPDLMARLLADNLSRRLGKPFVVENKAGAGGNLGVAEATDDTVEIPAHIGVQATKVGNARGRAHSTQKTVAFDQQCRC